MTNLKIEINNIKKISKFSLELPIEQGLYAIAGANGIGKSTIMALIAVIFRPKLLTSIFSNIPRGSSVSFTYDGKFDQWVKGDKLWVINGDKKKNIWIDGFIEGSVIHGTRFTDATLKMLSISANVKDEDLVDADDFINDNFSQILHGKTNVYPSIKK